MANIISLDGDVAQHNVTLLTQLHDEVANNTVDQVDGNRATEVAAAYTDHLDTRAGELKTQVDAILTYVRDHADALSKAVAALQERDAINASDAQQALSLIDTASQPPTDSGASAGASGGGSAGVRSALPGYQP